MRTGPGFISWISIQTVMSSEGLNACITQCCLTMNCPFRAEPFRKSNLVSTVLANFIEVGYSWTQIWIAISKDRFKTLFQNIILDVIISSERLPIKLNNGAEQQRKHGSNAPERDNIVIVSVIIIISWAYIPNEYYFHCHVF